MAAAEAQSGTDMSKVVNAEHITDNWSDDGYVNRVSKGLTRTPGMLRLELSYYEGDRGNKRGLDIKSARIEGLKNDAFAQTVEQTPIKDLDMPVVARFNDSKTGGFVIGRNEASPPQFWASQEDSTTLVERYPGLTAEEAAQKILDRELGVRKAHGVKRG